MSKKLPKLWINIMHIDEDSDPIYEAWDTYLETGSNLYVPAERIQELLDSLRSAEHGLSVDDLEEQIKLGRELYRGLESLIDPEQDESE